MIDRLAVQSFLSTMVDLGVAPNAVVSKILWSDGLRFLDRLWCSAVCKTWQSLLQHRPGDNAQKGSSHELCIWTAAVNPNLPYGLRVDADPPTLFMTSQNKTAFVAGFCYTHT